MARLSKREKFQAKIGIQLDHVRAGLIELKAKAREIKLDTRTDIEKSLDALEKMQRDIKDKLEDWAKAGQDTGKDLQKTIKRSAKSLRKSVKKAYKSLT